MIRPPLMNPEHEEAVISQHAGGRIVGEAIHLETTILGNAHRRVPMVAAVEHPAVACGLAAGEQHHRAIELTTASSSCWHSDSSFLQGSQTAAEAAREQRAHLSARPTVAPPSM
jgi:hypothetical protein